MHEGKENIHHPTILLFQNDQFLKLTIYFIDLRESFNAILLVKPNKVITVWL